ncbi:Ldh family oxidoreductase [Amycolatopsis alkalitolerans]|uniref:Ldh family oxidoreductase n=1 Tax=Amycolatopsis alkalitolerans TaxID=2547244 RepID=A0A5C4M002_9PSEU|nr:Ldh family oxidoreductase [Amycolatopsis alkalitolerans]TNC25741.1 Ldh family oxidoreductase [Amycolatopsis alkalitolerans]
MITVAEATALAARLLVAAGLPEARAEVSARCIVQADVWGIGSHGLMRLPFYLERIRAGGYPASAELRTVTDSGPLLALEGGGGLGHWQLWEAAEEAVKRCQRYGIAAVSVADSGHCGALGLYTVPGLRSGFVTLAFSNGPAVMPPWGGSVPVLSTSPIAAGLPTKPRSSIVDLATSAVARGKIAALAKSGTPVPEGWALDSAGRPTTDPAAALHGMLSPLGGAKGFALAFLVEALAGAVVGPNLSSVVPDMFAPDQAGRPQRIGHLLICLDPARFGGEAAYERLTTLATTVHDGGGRVPGGNRMLPEETPPGHLLTVAGHVLDELAKPPRRP